MDTDRADRKRKSTELEFIFSHIMIEGTKLFEAETATLFILDEDKNELWSQVATGTKGIIKVKAVKGIIGSCIQTGQIINVPDAYKDKRFNPEVGGKTDKVLGAIQMVNKINKDGSPSSFGPDDETLLTMMASHVNSLL
ncbi:hypothetical protein ACHAXS_008689 [Conticribra weissflogii]